MYACIATTPGVTHEPSFAPAPVVLPGVQHVWADNEGPLGGRIHRTEGRDQAREKRRGRSRVDAWWWMNHLNHSILLLLVRTGTVVPASGATCGHGLIKR